MNAFKIMAFDHYPKASGYPKAKWQADQSKNFLESPRHYLEFNSKGFVP